MGEVGCFGVGWVGGLGGEGQGSTYEYNTGVG